MKFAAYTMVHAPVERPNNEPGDSPAYESVADMILHQRRLNEQRAAHAARAFADKVRADGLNLPPSANEVIYLRVLTALDEQLERNHASTERNMAESVTPTLLH
jgi:hypothetical protein